MAVVTCQKLRKELSSIPEKNLQLYTIDVSAWLLLRGNIQHVIFPADTAKSFYKPAYFFVGHVILHNWIIICRCSVTCTSPTLKIIPAIQLRTIPRDRIMIIILLYSPKTLKILLKNRENIGILYETLTQNFTRVRLSGVISRMLNLLRNCAT